MVGTPLYMAYEVRRAYENKESSAMINWTKADVVSVAIMIINMGRLATSPSLNKIDFEYQQDEALKKALISDRLK